MNGPVVPLLHHRRASQARTHDLGPARRLEQAFATVAGRSATAVDGPGASRASRRIFAH